MTTAPAAPTPRSYRAPEVHTDKYPGHLVLATNGAMFIVGDDGVQRPWVNPRLAAYQARISQ